MIAFTLHEYAHAYVAYKFGDPTAKNQGRLTFNPIKHLDPIGTILIFIIGFGGWESYARLTRALILSAQEEGYVFALKSLGIVFSLNSIE